MTSHEQDLVDKFVKLESEIHAHVWHFDHQADRLDLDSDHPERQACEDAAQALRDAGEAVNFAMWHIKMVLNARAAKGKPL
jgi:hypothetical protein